MATERVIGGIEKKLP